MTLHQLTPISPLEHQLFLLVPQQGETPLLAAPPRGSPGSPALLLPLLCFPLQGPSGLRSLPPPAAARPLVEPLTLVSESLGAVGFKRFVQLRRAEMQSQTPLGPTPDLSEGQLKVVGKVAQPWGPGVGRKGTGGQEAGSQPHNLPSPLSGLCFTWFDLFIFSSFPAS